MTGAGNATRQRLVDTGSELFGRHGYTATGLKAIVTESGAPVGSLYHFFPKGKEELGAEAMLQSGRHFAALIESVFDAEDDDVASKTWRFFRDAAVVVEASDYADACPIATVAAEVASSSEPMREACGTAFRSWLTILEGRYAVAGIDPADARRLAISAFCAIEGAFLLARTLRSTEPILVAGAERQSAVAAALPQTEKGESSSSHEGARGGVEPTSTSGTVCQ